jgi:hypothetical protein
MRRIFALATLSALAATAAHAETWTSFAKLANGAEWYYDTDYTYRDTQTGRIVVMQAIGKPGAEPRMGPSGPGKPDGAGSVVAMDCGGKNMIVLGGYSPKRPLELSTTWRTATPGAAKSVEDKALVEAVCKNTAGLPSK